VAPDIQHGITLATQAIDSGAAKGKLEAVVGFSQGAQA
jgi:anthranilate phosphoribosyltransferase